MFGKVGNIYYCDYCGHRMRHIGGDLWKCNKHSCSAEAYMNDGVLEFDDAYNKEHKYENMYPDDIDD